MAESTTNIENPYCLACLSSEHKIQDYNIQFAHFRAIFEVDTIKLCYLCKKMARRAEIFIQNVQSNQKLLENCLEDLSTTIQEARSRLQPLPTLSLTDKFEKHFIDSEVTSHDSKTTIDKAMLICNDTDEKISTNQEDRFFNVNITNLKVDNADDDGKLFGNRKNNIKLELEEEEDIPLHHLEEELIINDEFQDSDIKEEVHLPLEVVLKEEKQVEGTEAKGLQSLLREKEVLKEESRKKIESIHEIVNETQSDDEIDVEMIYITEEECMQERKQQALDQIYLNCTYKCADCVKAFNFRASYDAHLEKHSESAGAFKCTICKLRMDTEEKLIKHRRCHTRRYKCTECGLVRKTRSTIKDHYSAIHCQSEKYPCPYCAKAFKRQVSLRKHIKYAHVSPKDRLTCAYCQKTYKGNDSLKTHMMLNHPKEVSAIEPVKRYACEECGMAFKTPSLLKNHGAKHLIKRDYYCVECDKAFKSKAVLKQHLRLAQPHMKYLELPLSCQHCENKFAVKRDLQRHINSVHLDVKPFQCDQCEKAYVNVWSLNEHKRHIHEGYKRPPRYRCHLCDKIFDSKSTLKAHIRTHTGERPYQCSKCPAQFSQSGALCTHNKLVHLRLTRDGRPKQISKKSRSSK